MSKFVHALETGLFQARWILTPLYVGLVLALVALVIRFCIEFVHLVEHIGTADPHTFTLDLLALLDLTLLGNLILIVIFAGYENFISRIYIPVGNYHAAKLFWNEPIRPYIPINWLQSL